VRGICGREQDGFVLPIALGFLLVLTIVTVSATNFTVLNLHASERDTSDVNASRYADAALNSAYAIINAANTTGKNPAAANLLGCAGFAGATDTNGPSNCATPSPFVFCYTGATSCTSGTAGSGSVYGFFSGTTAQTFSNISVPPSTWLVIATGYAPNNAGPVDTATKMALVKISALSAGAVAAVWNHVFVTAPLVSNQCALSFGGNNVTITVPLYVVGNMCLGSGGTGAVVAETTQPVDVQVGGKLVLNGGSKIGADSAHPITSGVVVGGCTTVSVTSTTSSCSGGGFSYWVNKADTWVSNQAPGETDADIANDYATFDPGPKHTCQTGTTPSPLASTTFDNDTTFNRSAASFELTPSSSYACISSSGTSKGYLIWNNNSSGSITVSGITVPAKTLAINGSIFFDGNVTISQSATYKGSAVVEAAGSVTFNGNGIAVCAESPCNTSSNAWQGSSGNNSMLTLVALATSGNSVTFTNNAQTFQGSLWTQPSAGMTFVKNGVTVEGPMSIGTFDASFNNATLIPLPVIKNMPVGAPIPPNTSASIGWLQLLN
jgi:Tfp pilus assembly protein PilX